ncbi:MOSC domain-containing protein [Oryzobacter telluris]|uniref:MOSC domain-containing protein n=1 Tax=Oryzobacter telluris TaxID=3149179 RepID=UPI00370D7CE6
MTARLTGLAVHPVKSTAIRPMARAVVEPWGLADDRRWMVVDPSGECLTAREERRLFTVTASTPSTDPGQEAALRLSAPGLDPLDVAVPQGDPVQVTVHGRPLEGVVVAEGATAWLRDAVGHDDLRLVHVHRARALNPEYGRPGDATAFADAYPVTLASAVSLRRLHDWLAETALERGDDPGDPLPMTRFRPNLVVDGDLEPFEEDGWSVVTVGDVRFRVVKGVDRCVMTTVDPVSLDRGHEPIRTLARHRKRDGATWFAMQLVPEVGDVRGVVAVGDEVTPER